MPLRAAASAVTCAANGVDLREPLKPAPPADSQAMTLPSRSVSVTIVLLKLDLMCATPTGMFLRTRRRPPPRRAGRCCAIRWLLPGPRATGGAKSEPGKDAGRSRWSPSMRPRTQPRRSFAAPSRGARVGKEPSLLLDLLLARDGHPLRTLARAGVGLCPLSADGQAAAMAEAA